MKNLDCNQIKIFNNLETIGEDNNQKKKKSIFCKNLTKFL